MSWIALKMLTGDRSKYFGIIFGVAFAALLMAQQMAIFVGIMLRTTSQIRDVQEVSACRLLEGVWLKWCAHLAEVRGPAEALGQTLDESPCLRVEPVQQRCHDRNVGTPPAIRQMHIAQ